MDNRSGRAARVGRPVEAGLSATARPPTIDDMLREPKEKLMRYATCGMGVGAAPPRSRMPIFQENLPVSTASNPLAEWRRIENRRKRDKSGQIHARGWRRD
ncbi:hypothetical protein [Burkholderia sp. AU45388]|uniref:hypothetical protein n=1 Tax=Burkholderia sp. AU45388 TaxID=3059206 RepID=UPI002652FA0C|nr:hypothetical protein [Burkholderia sp. AU45388]MDN7425368.1 hypothetical protein [Burkholderia sp. AU45388]